jgi:hypothetical protein
MYLEVPIIGSGARVDPYRASLRVPKSCVIPSNLTTGAPKQTTTLAWVADKYDTEVDRSIRRIPATEARALIRQLDPKANPDRLEQKRTAVSPNVLIPGLVAASTPLTRRAVLIGAALGIGALLFPPRAHALTFTQLATADFTGTDNAELGSSWDSGYTDHIAFTILTNQAVTGANTTATESYNAITWPNDQYSQIVLINFEGAGTGENLCGVFLRATAPPTKTYYICHTSAFTTGTVFEDEIAKSVAGSYTTLADDVPASAWANNDVLKGAVLGTDLYLFKNGVEVLSASDSDISAGRGGMYLLWFGSQGLVNQPIYDNWVGGEVTADGGSIPRTLGLLGVGR